MNNLPKLSTTFQQTQLRPQINQNQQNQTKQIDPRRIITSSEHRNLSPFTWNNIKLPVVFIKDKQQKMNSLKQVQPVKQSISSRLFSTLQATQPLKFANVAQKAKKAFNISMQLKKSIPLKGSPVKNLHEQVIQQYQKRMFTGGPKKRENRSFSEKQSTQILSKGYETMALKSSHKIIQASQTDRLKKTQQRYRNVKSIYEAQLERKVQTGYQNRQTYVRGKIQRDKSPLSNNSLRGQLNDSIRVKSSRNSFGNGHQSSSVIYQQMQPYIRSYFMNLASSHDPHKHRIFVTTNPKYHPLHMNQHNSFAFDQNGYGHQNHCTLIWTKLQSLNIFRQKSPEQYYNHIEGSHILTSKERLHEILNGGNGQSGKFYPLSFSLPKDYNQFVEEYDWTLVKMCLKLLVKEINAFQKGININTIESQSKSTQSPIKVEDQFNTCLSDILDDLTRDTRNQQQLKLVKFCLFLESGRKKHNLNQLFETMQTYRVVDINLSETVYINIIQWCFGLKKLCQTNLQQSSDSAKSIAETLGFSNVDYRLLQLLKAYDYLFRSHMPAYLYSTLNQTHNTWVIKPFASSKAAGISLIINSTQFYTTPDYSYKQYKLRSKYHNKIFMKYIENPLLIKHSGIDFFVKKLLKQLHKDVEKLENHEEVWSNLLHQINHKIESFLKFQEKFCGRKFDIRQWVIIGCEQTGLDGSMQKSQEFEMTKSIAFIEGRKSPRNKAATTKITKMYKYHTAYCRFAQKQYSLNTSDLEVHLTNYELYKKSSPLKNDKRLLTSKDNKSLNSSILQKEDYKNSLTEQNNAKIGTDQRVKTRKRLGSITREERESVLMVDEFFEYLDFIAHIKDKKSFLSYLGNSKSGKSESGNKYETQLNNILSSLFKASMPHLVHHNRTYELFGVDLLLDQNMNLYLLEVNLNPGCSSDREQKLKKEAGIMVETLFETVMGLHSHKDQQNQQKSQEQKTKQDEKYILRGQVNRKDKVMLNDNMIGSRQIIYQNDIEITDSKNEVVMDSQNLSKYSDLMEFAKAKQLKKQKSKESLNGQKWILVCENNAY